jgi:hypothetical protein
MANNQIVRRFENRGTALKWPCFLPNLERIELPSEIKLLMFKRIRIFFAPEIRDLALR